MATRKTSTTGAYMSQYDQEVEKRLKALEAQPKAASASSGDEGRIAALEAKVELLISILKMNTTLNIEKLSKGGL